MLYQVQAQTKTEVTDSLGTWEGAISSPTFYLDSNVQGIVSKEHAAKIVRHWLSDAGLEVIDVTVAAQGEYFEVTWPGVY